jgi:hypothetical protein
LESSLKKEKRRRGGFQFCSWTPQQLAKRLRIIFLYVYLFFPEDEVSFFSFLLTIPSFLEFGVFIEKGKAEERGRFQSRCGTPQ